jgi:acetyl esterase/lipase
MQFLIAFIFAMTGVVLLNPASAQDPDRQGNNAFKEWDANGDGKVSREEFPPSKADVFNRVDTNGDGFLSRQEDTAYRNRRRGQDTENQAGSKQGPQLPDGIELTPDITYATINGRELKLDFYAPKVKPKKPMPVVMWIHGGGWKGGSKNNPRKALPILERGYILVSVGYRLSGEAIFPAAIADCKAAVRWVRANAKTHGMDPDRVGVWGSSAGGHLVALLGTAGDVTQWDAIHEENADYSSRPNAVCDWFGPTDFLRMNDFPSKIDHDADGSPESRFIGAPIQTVPEKTQLANPIKYISEKTPPFLIMHGDNDMSVCYNQSELLFGALLKAGHSSQLYKVVGGGHGFRGAKNATPEILFKMSADFFDQQFKAPPKREPRQRTRSRKPAVSAATLELYEPGEFKGVKYRLMKPIDYDPAKKHPLVLSLHGAGGRGSDNIQTLRNWNELMVTMKPRKTLNTRKIKG